MAVLDGLTGADAETELLGVTVVESVPVVKLKVEPAPFVVVAVSVVETTTVEN